MGLKEFELTDKVAIVTGAGRGIGKEIALTLAEAGADIVAAARTEKEINKTADEVKSLGRRAIAVQTDVTKADQVKKMVDKAIAEFDKIDILVNNAGVLIMKPITPMVGWTSAFNKFVPFDFKVPFSEEEWDLVINTNLKGLFLCCRAVGQHMMERKQGKVINIGSIEAYNALKFDAVYCASQGGINSFSRALADEWVRYNINVNVIAPSYVETDMYPWIQGAEKEKKERQEAAAKTWIPMRRFGEPREIGLLAVYLASKASDYMTGEVICLDGGIPT
jgi:NAD(P)-dependent dehydrogenase (short-subunit alcohol dehydrogenase family)